MNKIRLINSILMCFFLFFSTQLLAQIEKKETPQYKYAFKGYLTFSDDKKTSILTTTDSTRTQTTTQFQSAILPSIGWSKFRKNGRFTEINLTRLRFDYQESKTENKVFQRDSFGNLVPAGDIPTRGTKLWTNAIGLRFEWNFPVFHLENNDFNAYLGISTDPSVYFQKTESFSSAAFPTQIFDISNTFTCIPRLTYAVSNRLFIDLNIPISFFTFGVNYNYQDNPTLHNYARSTTNLTAYYPTNIWALRIGIGYKI